MLAENTLLVRYTVTGGDAVYAIPFRVYRPEDVAVTWSSDGRTETELALGKDYSVQLVATGGAELRLVAGVVGGAVPAGATLAIASAIPETQEADFSNTATVNTGALETQLDREVQMIQQLHTELKRAVKVPAASSESPEDLLQNIYTSEDNAAQSAAEAAAAEQRVAACSCAQRAETAAEAAEASADRAQNTLVQPPTATTRGAIRVGHGLELVGGADGVEDVLQPVPDIAYSASEAAVAVKAVTLANFVSYSGARLCLVLSYTNTATAPALSVNNGEAMPILWGGTAPAPGSLVAGIPYLLICDGTAWNVMGLRPDGATTTVNGDGLLSALGGNLQWNTEEWITESENYTIPYDGIYFIESWNGGDGAWWLTTMKTGQSGRGNAPMSTIAYYTAGTIIPVTIGSGGLGEVNNNGTVAKYGGLTRFGDFFVPREKTLLTGPLLGKGASASSGAVWISGCGAGGGQSLGGSYGTEPAGYGAGGSLAYIDDTTITATNGAPGAIRLIYHDPAKANGPATASTFALSRKAARAAKPAAVNLYDPETGQGSVWREEDAPAKLAEGLITREAWQELCARQAAEAHAAWLADPDTEAERFALLRSARDATLAATDYLVAPDYPLTSEQKVALTIYRQALRDLPAKEGAPWDGGGELTPWPEMPASV